jgi:signal transduction histidine kinase
MRALFPTLSIVGRLPLLMGIAIFVSSVGTTHLAINVMDDELDQEIERLADVYIDSLSGVALPPLRAGDFQALEATLERSMGFQRGVNDLAIVVADTDGRPLARAGQAIGEPPMAVGAMGAQWVLNASGTIAWAQREMVADGQVVALVAAQIAFPALAARRRRMALLLTVLDVMLGGGAAALVMTIARQLMRPLLEVTTALDQAGRGRFEPIDIAGRGQEAARLAHAFNLMIQRLREREELSQRLAERERAAVLGRLAASIAHEVRNPLAGMLTALDTIARFGDDRAARQRALSLVERGLRQIQGVVSTTLATYRQEDNPRALHAEDLEDLKLLVLPQAERGQVLLGWRIDLPVPFPTDALRLRQLLLNLLLNATAATPPGGNVLLTVRQDGTALLATVEDEAGGLPPEAHALLSGTAPAGTASPGLGLEIAGQLVALLGARIGLEARPGGSRIIIHVPARPEEAA